MSCSVPRVFFVFDLAIFTRNEAHSLLFPNIVPKDDAKVRIFFVILHYKLKLVKYAVPNITAEKSLMLLQMVVTMRL